MFSIIRWRSTRHDELWFASGHTHHGFTLGAVTGRLVADVGATGTRFIDAQPFRPGRF
jgi:D-amino-acid dehydrogenase